MKKITVRCPYCGATATLKPSSAVYGAKDIQGGYLYVCNRYPKCNSYVSAHRKSKLPMGTLANGDLRHKRIKAHQALRKLSDMGAMTKQEAYRWMQAELGLDETQAHIGKFDESMCDKLILTCSQASNKHMKAA